MLTETEPTGFVGYQRLRIRLTRESGRVPLVHEREINEEQSQGFVRRIFGKKIINHDNASVHNL